jgi:hypothetical protein
MGYEARRWYGKVTRDKWYIDITRYNFISLATLNGPLYELAAAPPCGDMLAQLSLAAISILCKVGPWIRKGVASG